MRGPVGETEGSEERKNWGESILDFFIHHLATVT